MKKPKQTPPLLEGKYAKIEALPIGEAARFRAGKTEPLGEAYWRINSARIRAEKKTGNKYAIRKRGAMVVLIRKA